MNQFFERRYYISGLFIALIVVILIRLFFIQVSKDRYSYYADINVIRTVISYPARGVVLDRNGILLTDNRPVFDIMVIPKSVKPFDTLAFCRLLKIDQKECKARLIKAINFHLRRPASLRDKYPLRNLPVYRNGYMSLKVFPLKFTIYKHIQIQRLRNI